MNIKRKMGSDYKIKINGSTYIPQEISAMILRKIKNDAEVFLGKSIKKAVVTVPAYFNDNQRTATRDAGVIAGLDIVRIINEPTAASLAYGLDKLKKDLNIAVLDLGGGTFDVTILEMCNSVFRVISTSGDTCLGGIDMDKKITDYVIKKWGKNIKFKDEKNLQQLNEAVEKAKIQLSSKTSANMKLPFTNGNIILTRDKLETLVKPVVQRMDEPIKQALNDAKLNPGDIDKVVLVGGPTKMPIVRENVKKFFGKKPEEGVNPMQCVSVGAAIQGSILSGEMKNLVLLDVTPLSLGIETSGAVFTKLIERNTTIPAEESRVFTTAQDYQKTVPIHILQGERALAHDNITLGVFNLTGIKPAPRHEPMIDVAFNIDVNGILNVSAEDLETGKKQKIIITASTKLPEKEIERMIMEAKTFAETDKRKEENIKNRNRANALIYEVEKTIKEEKHASAQEKRDVKEVTKKLKTALKEKNNRKIKKSTDELTKIVDRISAKSRICKQTNALIVSAEKIIKKAKIPKKEKENIREISGKLKKALKGNTENIKKQMDKLTEELIIL
ncbi:MAG: Hsp70 family protein, partial [Thermoplasmatales archaeon]|nr:Hsp70 family protein [Thermoplasmatales archaeon]